MIALLKKDWRVNRAPVVGSIALLAGIYIVMGIVVLSDTEGLARHMARGNLWDMISDYLFEAGAIGLWLSPVIASVFGGSAFAAERRERSADFLAMLPARRGMIVLSKGLIAWLGAMSMWGVSLLVMFVATSQGDGGQDIDLEHILWPTGCLIMCFGVAWLLSTFLSSPAISASVSIGITAASLSILAMRFQRDHVSSSEGMTIAIAFTVATGLICYIAGTIYYLFRIEP